MMTFEEFIDDTLQRAVNGEMDNKEYVQGLRAVKDYFSRFSKAGFRDGLSLLAMDHVIKGLLERAVDGEIVNEEFEREIIEYKKFLVAYGRAGLALDLLDEVMKYKPLRDYIQSEDICSNEDIRQVLSSMNPRRPKRV